MVLFPGIQRHPAALSELSILPTPGAEASHLGTSASGVLLLTMDQAGQGERRAMDTWACPIGRS